MTHNSNLWLGPDGFEPIPVSARLQLVLTLFVMMLGIAVTSWLLYYRRGLATWATMTELDRGTFTLGLFIFLLICILGLLLTVYVASRTRTPGR